MHEREGGQHDVVAGDYSTYNGMRIGLLARNTYNDSFKELAKEKGIECDFEKIKADMEYRDKNDSQRAVAPLKKADDATLIDTTEYDFDGAVKLVKDLILEKTEG